MQWSDVLLPVGIFAALGLLFGILLAIASRVFAVKVDKRIPQVLELLPGANCGGCGRSGCAAMAEAIVKGEASPNACTVCSKEGMAQIGAIMGIEVKAPVPMRAHVMCAGDCDTAVHRFRYEGAEDCLAAEKLGGGEKVCPYGCIGLGSCVKVCKYHAIHIKNGIAEIDDSRCIGCGACTAVCPKHIIYVIPVSSKYAVHCRSAEKGIDTRKHCMLGCISCRLCEKNCPEGAITVDNFVASIDQDKCTGCGKCAEKCPRKIIKPV